MDPKQQHTQLLQNKTPKTSIYIPVNSGWLVMGSLFHGLYTVEVYCIPWKSIVLIQTCPFLVVDFQGIDTGNKLFTVVFLKKDT